MTPGKTRLMHWGKSEGYSIADLACSIKDFESCFFFAAIYRIELKPTSKPLLLKIAIIFFSFFVL